MSQPISFDIILVRGKCVQCTYSEIGNPSLDLAGKVGTLCIENNPPRTETSIFVDGLFIQGSRRKEYTVWAICRDTGVPPLLAQDIAARCIGVAPPTPLTFSTACRVVIQTRHTEGNLKTQCEASRELGTIYSEGSAPFSSIPCASQDCTQWARRHWILAFCLFLVASFLVMLVAWLRASAI